LFAAAAQPKQSGDGQSSQAVQFILKLKYSDATTKKVEKENEVLT